MDTLVVYEAYSIQNTSGTYQLLLSRLRQQQIPCASSNPLLVQFRRCPELSRLFRQKRAHLQGLLQQHLDREESGLLQRRTLCFRPFTDIQGMNGVLL